MTYENFKNFDILFHFEKHFEIKIQKKKTKKRKSHQSKHLSGSSIPPPVSSSISPTITAFYRSQNETADRKLQFFRIFQVNFLSAHPLCFPNFPLPSNHSSSNHFLILFFCHLIQEHYHHNSPFFFLFSIFLFFILKKKLFHLILFFLPIFISPATSHTHLKHPFPLLIPFLQTPPSSPSSKHPLHPLPPNTPFILFLQTPPSSSSSKHPPSSSSSKHPPSSPSSKHPLHPLPPNTPLILFLQTPPLILFLQTPFFHHLRADAWVSQWRVLIRQPLLKSIGTNSGNYEVSSSLLQTLCSGSRSGHCIRCINIKTGLNNELLCCHRLS